MADQDSQLVADFFKSLAQLAIADSEGSWPSGPADPLVGRDISRTAGGWWWRPVAEGYDGRLGVRVYVNGVNSRYGVFFSLMGSDYAFRSNVKQLWEGLGEQIDSYMGIKRSWVVDPKTNQNQWMQCHKPLTRDAESLDRHARIAYTLVKKAHVLWDRLLRDPTDAIAAGELSDQVLVKFSDRSVELPSDSLAGIETEFEFAERSQIEARTQRLVDHDLGKTAPEGIIGERWSKFRARAAWLAQKFLMERRKSGVLVCDECGFNPSERIDPTVVNPRSILDVHHKNPLAEGVRRTTFSDLALLCPTCHRIEHALLKVKASMFRS